MILGVNNGNLKTNVENLIKKLPADVKLKDIQFHLYVLGKIEKGIQKGDEEGWIDHKGVKKGSVSGSSNNMKILIRYFFLINILVFLSTIGWAQDDKDIALDYRKNGDNQMAIYYFEKALVAGENDSWIYNNLASSYRETDQYEKALNCARDGYNLYPNDKDLKYKLKIILFELAKKYFNVDLEKTEYYSQEILKLDPNNFNALHYYGLALRNSAESKKIHQSVNVMIQAVRLNPSHEWVLHNMLNAFSYSLRRYVIEDQLVETLELVLKLYEHYDFNQDLYKEKAILLYELHWIITLPFFQKYGGNLSGDVQQPRIPIMQKILEYKPDNFYMKNSIGVALTDTGKDVEGYQLREEAYADYLKIIAPDLSPIIIRSPLEGRIINVLHVSSGVWQPSPHSGIRKHAIDFIILDENDKNIGAGKAIYIPIDGIVSRIVNDDAEHSRIEIEVSNDLTFYMSHFQPGSIILKTGQQVKSGTYAGVLGELINMVPHLHIEFTNEYHVSHPIIFEKYRTDTEILVNNKLPEKGEVFRYP